jgi:hypothetical protein
MRWTFCGLAVASLLLCVAVVALWVRSYRVDDTFIFRKLFLSGRLWDFEATSVTNRMELVCVVWRFDMPADAKGCWWTVMPAPNSRVDLGFRHGDNEAGGTYLALAVHHWLLIAMTAILPTFAVVRTFRRRQVKGQCPICSYNLTGNVSGICPECGTAISRMAST